MLLLERDASSASCWYWEYMAGSEACNDEDSASNISPALLLDAEETTQLLLGCENDSQDRRDAVLTLLIDALLIVQVPLA